MPALCGKKVSPPVQRDGPAKILLALSPDLYYSQRLNPRRTFHRKSSYIDSGNPSAEFIQGGGSILAVAKYPHGTANHFSSQPLVAL
jgi:hypothetical protein